MIDRINERQQSHIITVEDPIEYLHPSKKSLVNQRQVGIDCPTFNDALVAALRQDPDVILVGEIRDLETIRIALTAAETGHVISGSCLDGIGSGACGDVIVTSFTMNFIIASHAVNRIITSTASNDVRAIAAYDRVSGTAARQRVVSGMSVQFAGN